MMNANSGYTGYSMSNRAVEAYENGEKPLSKWTKSEIISVISEIDATKAALFKKVTLPVLKQHLLYVSSWHHTSKEFNRTHFYSVDVDKVDSMTEAEIQGLWSIKKEQKTDDTTRYKGRIHYLEWSGSRKHPKATEKVLDDVIIEEKGCFYIVKDNNGDTILRKKMDSNGTYVTRKA